MQGRKFIEDQNADAVVEATILFPIMIMIFAALVLLAIYLPTRAALQRATQYAATALSVESSDAWLSFSVGEMSYYWENDKSRLTNVYVALFSDGRDIQSKGDDIVRWVESRAVSSKAGVLTTNCYMDNKFVYKEIVVTAKREFTVPPGLTLVGFPETIPIVVTSTAVVQNGDEFVRNMDLAVEFIGFIFEKFGLTDVADAISSFGSKITSLLGL